jgi:hypothetical protein
MEGHDESRRVLFFCELFSLVGGDCFLRTGSSELNVEALRVGRRLDSGWFSFFLFCRAWGQGVAVWA